VEEEEVEEEKAKGLEVLLVGAGGLQYIQYSTGSETIEKRNKRGSRRLHKHTHDETNLCVCVIIDY
jgi:hypothetical protein